MSPDESPPLVKVILGNPNDEELAALVALLVAAGSNAPAEPAAPQRRWASPATRLRSAAYGPRPGGWRASGLPR